MGHLRKSEGAYAKMPILGRVGLRDGFEALRDDALDACDEREPAGIVSRALLAAYLVYAGVRHIANPLYRSWFAGITLVFHEMGHPLFSPLGHTMMLLGGSITQLLIPLAAGLYLLFRQRDWFGLAVCTAWFAFSAWELATYIADANKEQLPLVSLGGAPEHDWSNLLTQWHWLNACDAIGTFVRSIAFVSWFLAMSLACWLLWQMWKLRQRPAI